MRARRSLLLLAPLVVLLAFAYAWPLAQLIDESLKVEGLANYSAFFDSPVSREILLRTLRVAAICAGLCLALAYPLSAYVAARSPRLRVLLLGLVLIPLWTSVVVRSYSFIVILKPDGLLDSALSAIGLPTLDGKLLNSDVAVIIGMTAVLLPFAVLPLYAAFRDIDPSYAQAARSMGASRIRSWLEITFPLTRAAAIGGGLLVFLISLGFYVTPEILGGPDQTLIAQLIGQKVSRFELPEAAAISVLLLAVVAVLGGLMALARRYTGSEAAN